LVPGFEPRDGREGGGRPIFGNFYSSSESAPNKLLFFGGYGNGMFYLGAVFKVAGLKSSSSSLSPSSKFGIKVCFF